MNERIKELWSEAAKLETDDSWEGQTRFMEKFAELIIKECAEVACDYDGACYVGEAVTKHFGINND